VSKQKLSVISHWGPVIGNQSGAVISHQRTVIRKNMRRIFCDRLLGISLLGLVCVAWPTARAVEIEGMPVPGEAHRVVVGTPVEKKLANGLRVIVLERPGLPLLSAELIMQGGVETDPPQLSGLTKFTAGLLKRGTKTRTAPQIAQDIEALGATIDGEASWDFTKLTMTTLSANAEPALALVAELAREPAFAKVEIERARLEALDELKLALEQPGSVGRSAAIRATLPMQGHPSSGTVASVSRITAKDITAQHARLFRPEHAILVLAGSIQADEAFSLSEKLFGSWSAPALAAPAITAQTVPMSSPRVVLIDMPQAGQAAVFMATPSINRTAEDWFPGKVATTVLGGGYSSRLNQEIRVKRGLSYGAGSTLSTRRASGIFLASAQTKNESAVEVVKLMEAEFARLATEPVPEDYLQTRKSVLTGAMSRDLETNAQVVERLGELAVHDLPLDGLSQYFDKVEAVKDADLQTFAKAHLAVDGFTIVIAGQAKIVEKPLRAAFPKLEVIPMAKLDLDSPTLRAGGKK
jgi:zinc protease